MMRASGDRFAPLPALIMGPIYQVSWPILHPTNDPGTCKHENNGWISLNFEAPRVSGLARGGENSTEKSSSLCAASSWESEDERGAAARNAPGVKAQRSTLESKVGLICFLSILPWVHSNSNLLAPACIIVMQTSVPKHSPIKYWADEQ
jgi:hypothetical protein